MKKIGIIVLLMALAVSINTKAQSNMNTIHQFKTVSLDGEEIDFSDFKGKKILIVNTASECGYTPQYAGLQDLYEEYGSRLVIVGFPANNFGGQEPGTNKEIGAFCEKNFGVSFPMAAKVSVKGEDIDPIFQWLTQKDKNQVMDSEIKWNFTKFLLDEEGRLVAKYDSSVEPMSEEIIEAIHSK